MGGLGLAAISLQSGSCAKPPKDVSIEEQVQLVLDVGDHQDEDAARYPEKRVQPLASPLEHARDPKPQRHDVKQHEHQYHEREEGTGGRQLRRRIDPASFRIGKGGADEEDYQEEYPREQRQGERGYRHPGVFGTRFSHALPTIAQVNFREPPQGEVRRTLLLRTRVNKTKRGPPLQSLA